MPGTASIDKDQYYGHARNAFWPIMSSLLKHNQADDYSERCAMLRAHKIALWDVLASCQRPGSLDSNIDSQSMVCNDFYEFLQGHKHIRAIFFNGGKAEQVFNKQVFKKIDNLRPKMHYQRLPSTSPAMAAMTRLQKQAQWADVLQWLGD